MAPAVSVPCPLPPSHSRLHKGLPFSHPEVQNPAPKPCTEACPPRSYWEGSPVVLGLSVPPGEGTGAFPGWSQVTHGFVAVPHESLRAGSAGAAAYVAAFKGSVRRWQVPARPAQNRPNLGKQVRAGRGQGAASRAPGQGKWEEWGP